MDEGGGIHHKLLSDDIQLCAHLDRNIQKETCYGSPQQIAEDEMEPA